MGLTLTWLPGQLSRYVPALPGVVAEQVHERGEVEHAWRQPQVLCDDAAVGHKEQVHLAMVVHVLQGPGPGPDGRPSCLKPLQGAAHSTHQALTY